MNIFISDQEGQPVDIYSRLAGERVLFVGDLTDQEASDIVASLVQLSFEDPIEKITLLINSSGGEVRNAFMIYDAMKVIDSPIETICLGDAWQEAVLLLAAGTKGMRYASKSSAICPGQLEQRRYMQTDVAGVKDIMLRFQRDNKNFITELAKCSGKKFKDVMKKLERQQYFSAKEAKTNGLIDHIL
jgi:ATP-dependent Clp protease, protease subunit